MSLDINNQNGIAKAQHNWRFDSLQTENPTFTSDDDNFNKVKDFHHLMDGSQHMPVSLRYYG